MLTIETHDNGKVDLRSIQRLSAHGLAPSTTYAVVPLAEWEAMEEAVGLVRRSMSLPEGMYAAVGHEKMHEQYDDDAREFLAAIAAAREEKPC